MEINLKKLSKDASGTIQIAPITIVSGYMFPRKGLKVTPLRKIFTDANVSQSDKQDYLRHLAENELSECGKYVSEIAKIKCACSLNAALGGKNWYINDPFTENGEPLPICKSGEGAFVSFPEFAISPRDIIKYAYKIICSIKEDDGLNYVFETYSHLFCLALYKFARKYLDENEIHIRNYFAWQNYMPNGVKIWYRADGSETTPQGFGTMLDLSPDIQSYLDIPCLLND